MANCVVVSHLLGGGGGLNKTAKTNQDSRSYSHDLNLGPSDHEVRALQT